MPVHVAVQSCVPVLNPGQLAPPLVGAGESQTLLLSCVHVLSGQIDHSVHSPHTPSTAVKNVHD